MEALSRDEIRKRARERFEAIKSDIAGGMDLKDSCDRHRMTKSNFYQMRMRYDGAMGKKPKSKKLPTVVNIPERDPKSSSNPEVKVVIIKGDSNAVSKILGDVFGGRE